MIDPRLHRIVASQPYPLLFATLSGAHLYGFPSPDSDFDLRGSHLLPLKAIAGLEVYDETISDSRVIEGLEMDIVSHDIGKFFRMLLKKNGYVLEQLYSPLIVHTTAAHEELKTIAHGCITRYHAHHYLGFADSEWKLFLKESPRRVKPLLYVYRVLLTGIHLMQTGEIEANLLTLNATARIPFLPELIALKTEGPEQSSLPEAEMPLYETAYMELRNKLEEAHTASKLREGPDAQARAALNDLLIRLRKAEAGQ